jgi:uncharacterized protein (TIGR03643 family)
LVFNLARLRHASEQYFTSSQFLAQFLRHTISRPHTAHTLLGKLALLPLKPRGFAGMVDGCVIKSSYDSMVSTEKFPIIIPETLSAEDISRIIEMAWEDRTTFEAIERLFGTNESAVIALMRRYMKPSSFRMWRKRVTGRVTKHAALRNPDIDRAYCPTQYKRF